MQLMQVRPHCRISSRLVSTAMCHVDWREESLEIRGKLVAIQDRVPRIWKKQGMQHKHWMGVRTPGF